MREVRGDLWDGEPDVRVITTNGFVKKNGKAVMGRGVAKQLAQRWPQAPGALAEHLRRNGNHVGYWGVSFTDDVTDVEWFAWFPVKHNWFEKADPALIRQSAYELCVLAGKMGWQEVRMPRPGCGNGGLDWGYVKPTIEPLLDDRFVVVQL